MSEQLETRTSEELARIALGEVDDARWRLLAVIHKRGGNPEFLIGEAYCESVDARERELGADILAQLGWGEKKFTLQSLPVFFRLLEDPSSEVVISALAGLGHHQHESSVAVLCRFSRHPDVDIRLMAAKSLGGFAHPDAVAAVIELSSDSDCDVRNSATFALAHGEGDSPELRAALRARADDEDDDVRSEAVFGLARVRDPAAWPLVERELSRWAETEPNSDNACRMGRALIAAEMLGIQLAADP